MNRLVRASDGIYEAVVPQGTKLKDAMKSAELQLDRIKEQINIARSVFYSRCPQGNFFI